jgi:O-antigen/teichoic acid export membrane protein
MRSDSTIKNSVWGIVYHIIYVILGFVGRWIFIRILDVEYYGLNGLFSSIITMLSIADLGIGFSMSHNLYKPLAEHDEEFISKLMNLFKKIYVKIGIGVMLFGMAFTPFLRFFIHSDFSLNFIQMIFIIFIFENASTYFFSYNVTLLIADQKNYISTIFETLINVAQLTFRIIVLIITKDYIFYLVSGIAVRITGNLIRYFWVEKRYPYLKKYIDEELSVETRAKVFYDAKNIMVYKVSSASIGAVDNILIATLKNGVATVGYYSSYQMIINVVNGLAGQFINSYQASLGNLYVLEGREKTYNIFKKSNFIAFWVAAFCLCSLFALVHDFISLWLGERFIINNFTIEIIIINLGLTILFDPLSKIVNAVGTFKKDKFYALLECSVNLVLSVILLKLYGIIGIFIGTTIGITISSMLRGKYVVENVMDKSYKEYIKLLSHYIIVIIIECSIVIILCNAVNVSNPWIKFLIKMIICTIIPNLLNMLLFYRAEEFRYIIILIKSLISKLKFN